MPEYSELIKDKVYAHDSKLKDHDEILKVHGEKLIKYDSTRENCFNAQKKVDEKLSAHDKAISAILITLTEMQTQGKSTNKILSWIASAVTLYMLKFFLDFITMR